MLSAFAVHGNIKLKKILRDGAIVGDRSQSEM